MANNKYSNLSISSSYDVHQLKYLENKINEIMIGGIALNSKYQIINANSDGDVILHSIIDAILVAGINKNIGEIFSEKNIDNYYKNSTNIFQKALILIQDKIKIVSISLVVICDVILLTNHLKLVKRNLYEILKIYQQDCNINITVRKSEKITKMFIKCYSNILFVKK